VFKYPAQVAKAKEQEANRINGRRRDEAVINIENFSFIELTCETRHANQRKFADVLRIHATEAI
jgi:hypothetical protein